MTQARDTHGEQSYWVKPYGWHDVILVDPNWLEPTGRIRANTDYSYLDLRGEGERLPSGVQACVTSCPKRPLNGSTGIVWGVSQDGDRDGRWAYQVRLTDSDRIIPLFGRQLEPTGRLLPFSER